MMVLALSVYVLVVIGLIWVSQVIVRRFERRRQTRRQNEQYIAREVDQYFKDRGIEDSIIGDGG